jgi:predicted F0F1-ATPase subunit
VDKEQLRRTSQAEFCKEIGTQEKRKLRAQRGKARSIWLGLGMLGLIGWSVAIPALAGVGLGVWIDTHFPSRYSWTRCSSSLEPSSAALMLGAGSLTNSGKSTKNRTTTIKMNTAEIITLSLAALAGVLIGAIFFAGLWWTVQYGLNNKRRPCCSS